MNTPITQALNYIAKDEWVSALPFLRELVKEHPQKDVFYELYTYCLLRLETQDFGPCTQTPAETDPKLAAMRKKAVKLSDAGKYKNALLLWEFLTFRLQEKIATHPHAILLLPTADERQLIRLYYVQAVCHFLRGAPQAAKEAFAKSKELKRHFYKQCPVTCAQAYLDVGDWDAADNELSTAIYNADGEHFHEEHEMRGDIFAQKGINDAAQSEYELARTDIAHFLEENPTDRAHYRTLAGILEKQGRLDEALAANAKAIALWHLFPAGYFQRANLLAAQNDEKGALAQVALGKAHGVYYTVPQSLWEGEVYERLKKWKEAEKLYLQVPNTDQQYKALKRLYGKMNKPQKLERFKKQMMRRPYFLDRVSAEQLTELF